MSLDRWILTEEEQKAYTDALAQELAPLRAKAGISQIELCKLIGISRQTYSAVEGRRKPMTWQTYLSLIWFYDSNLETRERLRSLPAYPGPLLDRMNKGEQERPLDKDLGEVREIWKELDEQARHSLKTLLLVEYARCRKIPGDVVVKAFDGIVFSGKTPDAATEAALRNIRQRNHEG